MWSIFSWPAAACCRAVARSTVRFHTVTCIPARSNLGTMALPMRPRPRNDTPFAFILAFFFFQWLSHGCTPTTKNCFVQFLRRKFMQRKLTVSARLLCNFAQISSPPIVRQTPKSISSQMTDEKQTVFAQFGEIPEFVRPLPIESKTWSKMQRQKFRRNRMRNFTQFSLALSIYSSTNRRKT